MFTNEAALLDIILGFDTDISANLWIKEKSHLSLNYNTFK